MSILVGLTGPTGSGKSTAAAVAEKMGIKVIDCDKLARKAVESGSEGLKALVSAFGSDILASDGSLDRKAMAKKAFSSRENTELLNKTLLPHISELVRSQLDAEHILLDAPTLFESGLDSICDKTVAVLSDHAKRLGRIIERDSLTSDEALQRMNAGKNDKFYIERSDHIIYNNDGSNIFEFEIAGLFKVIYGGKTNV